MESHLLLAVILIAVGAGLLVAEFFLPTAGILVVGAFGAFACAVGVTLLYGDLREAAAVSTAVSIGLPVAGMMLVSAYKRMSLKSSLDPNNEVSETLLSDPSLAELVELKGKFGKAVTPLRPSGAVEFEGRRIDAVSEGLLIEPGSPVKCVDVKAGRVIVRKIDPPKGPASPNFDLDLG